MRVIAVNGHQNRRTESRGMLLKSTIQESDGDPGQDSRPLCLMLGRIGDIDHDPRHKVTSPADSRSLAETSHHVTR